MVEPIPDLQWVDSFIRTIKPYVFVRLRDNILIRMPNEAFRLNRTGAGIMQFLLSGGTVDSIISARKDDPDILMQLQTFFTDLSVLLSGNFCENYSSPALHTVPFELGYIALPILSEVAITRRCNIQCRFCYADSAPAGNFSCASADASRELSFDQIKEILNIIRKDAEVPSVSFTGGEPAIREDLPELIQYASTTLNMRVNLITNGTLITDKSAEKLKRSGLASAQVSIEAPDPEIHDRITGVPGSHGRSVAGLKALRNAGIHVHPHSTICSVNQNVVQDMALFAKSLGVDRFSANLVIPSGRGDRPELQVAYTEMDLLIPKIMSAAEKANVRFMWYSPTPLCLFNPVAHQLGNKGCSACEGLLSIDPEGNVLPCSSWPEPVGNILTDGFDSIWFGDRAVFIREKKSAHPECFTCAHFAVCQGACPLYFRVHGYAEIAPHFAGTEHVSGRKYNEVTS